ncbi:OLC1v1032092C1 [Oldenlandia corymbosa var. corymbosa]|uniref:OLC1v1032092C1 n=1 Tax=Oldenlandia corymbosa var. corymbosa TaxID=529605 RepID=A0AAV1CMX6_OLDCO|nr:OLC1v1032092C1 [Oldenlandia corymbosa var. corymbosa]
MAANKFATMVYRNSNKITLILIYAVLEWTLISLLLLNSLFSYLIIKFADYVGLKPPCLWCSRIDHLFDPTKSKNMHRDLLCEAHSAEISRLGYCSNHRKLIECQDLCEDCLSSRPEIQGKNVTVIPWIKDLGMIHRDGKKVGVEDNNEEISKCSCCGVELDSNKYSSYVLVKPSPWDDDVLEYSDEKMNLIMEIEKGDYLCELGKQRSDSGSTDQCGNGYQFGDKTERQMLSDFGNGIIVMEEEEAEDVSVSLPKKEMLGDEDEKMKEVLEEEEEEQKEELVVEGSIGTKVNMKDESVQVCFEEGESNGILPQHLEFFFDYTGNRLVPIDMIDSTTEEDQIAYLNKDENQTTENNNQGANLETMMQVESEENVCTEFESEAAISCQRTQEEEEPKYAVLESMEMEEDESSWVFQAVREVSEDVEVTSSSPETGDSKLMPVAEDEENNSEVSIGTEIPDLDATVDIQMPDGTVSFESSPEDHSTNSANLQHDAHHGANAQEQTLELQTLSIDLSELVTSNQMSYCPDLNGIDEEKVPDTPTSVDSFHNLHQKLLLLEKKDSGTEDSLDGSVLSDIEGGDGNVTPDSLKKALKAERKTLQALYAELEEERSASAVAANQTMAMINRLQEEKAQMQMEALQYQRMMEEQAEYDQEALQLLNELMVKREKEKQELEKELEVYKRKVVEYETREKVRMLRRSNNGSARSGFSSTSCSNAEDSDGLSIDLNQDPKEDDNGYCNHESSHHNTPVDAVMNLEESLADFEDERLSILEQLKVLEEKLMSLDNEGESQFEDVRPVEHLSDQNGECKTENGHIDGEMNGHTNGFSKEMNAKNSQERRTSALKGRNLLPVFDAVIDENGEVELNRNMNGSDHANGVGNMNGSDHANGVQDMDMRGLEVDYKNSAIEEEVEHLYERLQALEADREFLKHCISSLKKGDKGMDLLQEILQHLRDLRNVELRARNFSDGPLP